MGQVVGERGLESEGRGAASLPRGGGGGELPRTPFASMSTVCIWVGICAGGRFAYVRVTGLRSHFSICIVLVARLILKRRTIFTWPREWVNHHRASFLSLRNVSDTPTSKTSVGQSSRFGRKAEGLKHESGFLGRRSSSILCCAHIADVSMLCQSHLADMIYKFV
jgi:hypothetical protein